MPDIAIAFFVFLAVLAIMGIVILLRAAARLGNLIGSFLGALIDRGQRDRDR
jgi:uncharacterized membrane protein